MLGECFMEFPKKMMTALLLISLMGALGYTVWGQTGGDQTAPAEQAPAKAGPVPFGKYGPAQPIPYSHKLHAGDMQMPCQFCHTYARRSRSAGIPALEQCMACHTTVGRDKEPVQRLVASYDSKQAIEWIKVHDLPDFVFFSHQQHIQAGFECQECHGPVETMEVLYRQAPLTMGWCVNCHLDNLDKGASVDCLTCHQ